MMPKIRGQRTIVDLLTSLLYVSSLIVGVVPVAFPVGIDIDRDGEAGACRYCCHAGPTPSYLWMLYAQTERKRVQVQLGNMRGC
jgi:hypothetical protein